MWNRDRRLIRRVSPVEATTALFPNALRWTSDGRHVLAALRPASEPHAPSTDESVAGMRRSKSPQQGADSVHVQVFESPARRPEGSAKQSMPSRRRADLALIDVTFGSARRLLRDVDVLWMDISPKQDSVAVLVLSARDVEQTSYQAFSDLLLIDLESGRTRQIAAKLPVQRPNGAWSPDGRRLAYFTSGPGISPDATVVALDQGDPPIAASRHDGPAADITWMPPLWNESCTAIYFVSGGTLWTMSVPDGITRRVASVPDREIRAIVPALDHIHPATTGDGHLLVIAGSEVTNGFYDLGPAGGTAKRIWEDEWDVGGFGGILAGRRVAQSPHDQSVIFSAQAAGRPEDLWAIDSERGQLRQVTHLNPGLDRTQFGARRIVEWTDEDRQPHKGLVLLPSGYQDGRRYPLIVWVYSTSLRYANIFGLAEGAQFFNLQLFATRGYAVLYPDVEWRRDGTIMQGLADMVIPGIDRLVDLGIADRERVGVMGHSSGGYVALSLLVQWPGFKAGIASAAPASMVTGYGLPMESDGSVSLLPWVENQMGMNGTPWQYRDRFIENSPWFFLDRVTAPLLLLGGTADQPTILQMDAVFSGLRRLGKRVEYAKYDGEVHAEEWWSYPSKIDAAERMIRWFDTYVKNHETSGSVQ